LNRLFRKNPMRYMPMMPALIGLWRVPDEAFTDETWNELTAA
jgi:hypothetical protein